MILGIYATRYDFPESFWQQIVEADEAMENKKKNLWLHLNSPVTYSSVFALSLFYDDFTALTIVSVIKIIVFQVSQIIR